MSFGGDDDDIGRMVEDAYRDLGDRAVTQQAKAERIRVRRAERAAVSGGRAVGVLLYLAFFLAVVAVSVVFVHLTARFVEVVWRAT